MSTFSTFNDRDMDMQDGIERHVWSKQEYNADYGWMIKVKGTGTEDQEAMVMHGTMGFHLADDTDTEVFLMASSSDTTLKFALPTIPRNKQRQWKENTGGVQNPTDGSRALEFSSKRAYLDDANFATRGGIIEQIGDTVYIRGNLSIDGDLGVSGDLTVSGIMKTKDPVGPAPVVVPAFEDYNG
jgi:hypothetical protein